MTAGTERFTFASLRGETIGKPRSLSGYIAGESGLKAIYTKAHAKCSNCGIKVPVDLAPDPKALYKLIQREKHAFVPQTSKPCKRKKKHSWKYDPLDPPLTYQVVKVRDSLDAETEGAATNHSYTGYVVGTVPEDKEGELTGILFANSKTDDVEFLVQRIRPSSASITGFQLTPDETAGLQSYFRSRTLEEFKQLAIKNNPRIAERVDAKLAGLLAWVSPMWLLINGQRKAGTMRTLYFGDPRTGKGSIADYLRQNLRLGKHAIGENSSRTGITYFIDMDSGLLIWGVMVEADRGLVVLEALHKFPPEDMATMRETLVKLQVEVRRAYSAKAWARTRVIADANARQELGRYPYKCEAITNLECFKDSVDVTRWDLFIPFAKEDVNPKDISKAIFDGKEDSEFLANLGRLVLWAWSRRPEEVKFTPDALQEAREAFESLISDYALAEIPVVHEDSLASLMRLSAAFATLTFSTKDGISLRVEKRHVELANAFLRDCLDLVELREYKLNHGETELTEEDKNEYFDHLDRSELAAKIVDALAKGPKKSMVLEATIGHEASSVRRAAASLKALGIIDTGSAGYRLTKKGVTLWKISHATKATDATARDTRSPETNPSVGQGSVRASVASVASVTPGATANASIPEIFCAVEDCGTRLGASPTKEHPNSELTIHKIDRDRLCKKHYLERRPEA